MVTRQMRNKISKVTVGPDTRMFLERWDPLFDTYPYLFWFMMFAFAAGVSIVAAWEADEIAAYLGVSLPVSVGFLSVPLAFKYCHGRLIDWAENLKNFVVADTNALKSWFQEEFAFLYRGSKSMLFWGGVVGVSAVLAYFFGNYLPNRWSFATVFTYIVILCSAFLAGVGLFGIFCATRAFARLAKFPVRVEHHKFGVLSTGSTLLKVYSAITTVWIFYVLSAVIGHQFDGLWDLMQEPPMWLLAAPTFPFILGGFVVSQVPLHKRMVEFKKGEIFRIEKILEPLKFDNAQSLTEEVRAKIEFLERRKAQILSLPEWPFGFNSLMGAFGLSISASLPVVFEGIVLSVKSSLQ